MIFHFCFSVFSKMSIMNMLCFCYKKKTDFFFKNTNSYSLSDGLRQQSTLKIKARKARFTTEVSK